MNPRDPLTLKVARTARETARDPYNWWEGPAETHYVIGSAGAMRASSRCHQPRRNRGLIQRLAAWCRRALS